MKKLLFTLIFTVVILPACNATPNETPTGTPTGAPVRATYTPLPPRPTPNAAELEISDPAMMIEVIAGDQFTITVRTNRSPEYHWGVHEALDPNIVEYVWKDHVPDEAGNPNSSGRDVWRFMAVAPGRTTIILGYYRGLSIETSQKPVFTVVVK
jgi:predicted secreted protein